jgi:hypothetical protein
VGVPVTVHSPDGFSENCRPGGREPLMIFIVKSDPNNLSVAGEITVPSFTFSPAANGMPTFPGPTSQAPLLQAKVDVSIVGGAVAAARLNAICRVKL